MRSHSMFRARAIPILPVCVLLIGCAQAGIPPTPALSTEPPVVTSDAPITVPDELLHVWIGEERVIEGLGSPRDSTIFEFEPHDLVLSFGGTLTSDILRFGPSQFDISLA